MSTPIWQLEIRVHDLQRSIAFYGAVFDWKITPVADTYAMFDTGKAPIGGIWEIGDSGMPLGICHYLRSKSCTADAAKSVRLGGRVTVEHTVVEDVGAWTDTLDPWNNEVAFWQPDTADVPQFSGSGQNAVGLMEWGTSDLNAAMAYYEHLAGWKFERVVGATEYALCKQTHPPVALVGGVVGAGRRGILDYINVVDIVATAAQVSAHGGTVLDKPHDLGDGSLMTMIIDPDGNQWAILQKIR
jgi:predicted enzyme related to lactoylglutathione lyase